MRLVDADAFVTYLKSEKERQHLDKMKTEHLSVGDVIDAVVDDLNGTALCGYKNAPTVDPFKHGHWVDVGSEVVRICSCCHDDVLYAVMYNLKGEEISLKYCPYCGAKMDEVIE